MSGMKKSTLPREQFNKSGLRPAKLRTRLTSRRRDLIDVDFRGLGSKLCETLGVLSGDVLEFHMLGDGSVRVINYGKS
ncbi:MAG TPA: hypothetical protein VK503_11355 [Candidatus Bathyarchaeia archaeon]|nr:hypothetical protein [Candidatus Bathyarchaeia archaeon]